MKARAKTAEPFAELGDDRPRREASPPARLVVDRFYLVE